MREYCLMVHGDEIKEKNITGYSIRKASGTMEGLPAHNIKIRKGNSVAEALLWQEMIILPNFI